MLRKTVKIIHKYKYFYIKYIKSYLVKGLDICVKCLPFHWFILLCYQLMEIETCISKGILLLVLFLKLSLWICLLWVLKHENIWWLFFHEFETSVISYFCFPIYHSLLNMQSLISSPLSDTSFFNLLLLKGISRRVTKNLNKMELLNGVC